MIAKCIHQFCALNSPVVKYISVKYFSLLNTLKYLSIVFLFLFLIGYWCRAKCTVLNRNILHCSEKTKDKLALKRKKKKPFCYKDKNTIFYQRFFHTRWKTAVLLWEKEHDRCLNKDEWEVQRSSLDVTHKLNCTNPIFWFGWSQIWGDGGWRGLLRYLGLVV